MRIVTIGEIDHIAHVFQGVGELPDAVLCAAAPGGPDESLEETRWHAQERGLAPAFYDDYRRMLDCERPDVVVVATRLDRHAAIACEVLGRNLPVFCEKPLALTLADLARVRDAQQRSGRPVGMMLEFRYTPSYHTARRLVAEGRIGTPTAGYAQKSYKHGKRADFFRRRETFGGVLAWVGVDSIDVLRWVSGCELVAVSAAHSKLFHSDYPGMEDAATCLFELDNGGSVVMSIDYLRPAGAPTHGDDRLRLIGEHGVVEVQGRNSVRLITAAGPEEVAPEPPPHGLFADFVLAVRDTAHDIRLTTADAFRATEVALHARDAADSRKRVTLP